MDHTASPSFSREGRVVHVPAEEEDDNRDLHTILSVLTFEDRTFEDQQDEENNIIGTTGTSVASSYDTTIGTVASCDPPGSVADDLLPRIDDDDDEDDETTTETIFTQRRLLSVNTNDTEDEEDGCDHEVCPRGISPSPCCNTTTPESPVPHFYDTDDDEEENGCCDHEDEYQRTSRCSTPEPVPQCASNFEDEECPTPEMDYPENYFPNNHDSTHAATADTDTMTPSDFSPSVASVGDHDRPRSESPNIWRVNAEKGDTSMVKGDAYHQQPPISTYSMSITTTSGYQQQRKPYQTPKKSLRTTPMWMLITCASLLMALVILGLWSCHKVVTLNSEIDSYESDLEDLSRNTTTWTSKALTAEEANGSLQDNLATLESQVAGLGANQTLLLVQVAGLESQIDVHEQNVTDLETDKAVLEQNVANLEAKNEEWQQLTVQMQTSIDDMSEINSNLNATRLSLEESVASLTSQLETVSDENGDLNATRLQLLNEISNFQQAVRELESRNAELANLKTQLEAEKDALKQNTIPALNAEIQHCSAELNVTQDLLAFCRFDVTTLEADNTTCHENHADCQNVNANLSSDLVTCSDNKATCQENLNACETDLADMNDQYTSCNSERNDYKFTIVPDLDNQVMTLESGMATLQSEVDALEDQNSIYFTLNGKLNESIAELEDLTDDLNATNLALEEQVQDLNATILDLEDVNANLTTRLEDFQILTSSLNDTKNDLTEQVESLHEAVNDLNLENQLLQENVQNLDVQVSTLQTTRANLQQDVSDLQQERENLTDLVDLLEIRIDQLGVLSTYIEDATLSLETDYDVLLGDLTSQIELNRALAMKQLQNYYKDTSFWDCSIYDRFGGSSWLYDMTITIPPADIVRVINLVDRNVLNTMCLSRADFEAFLSQRYGGLDSITWDDMNEGVILYSEAARAYYFPLPGDPGLALEQWESAGYTCETVPPFQW